MYHYYAALRLDRRASQCPSSWKRVEVNIEKVGWLVLALLAPEVVAYTAW